MQAKDIVALEQLKENKKLEPYINYIRFPCFKSLEAGTRIDFDFPLTVIVGQNGTNKSSVLRAIQGCPKDYSLGNYWFSTDLDPISGEGESQPRYIYGYFQGDAKRDVEVIKKRAKRVYQNSEEINPDYWEPDRPRISDGMEAMPPVEDEDEKKLVGRKKTRWELMVKNVVFLDFRSEISSYDKFFYHGELGKRVSFKSKQDFIRKKSVFLKKVVDKNLQSKPLYRGRQEQVKKNEKLSSSECEMISEILGRNYVSIRLIEHCFFGMDGYSVILQSDALKYSEAFAGSGEFAVVMLVHKILSAPKMSLVILDEPEVSLHPGAQTRLVAFLVNEIRKNKHQIVVGTHSPFIVKGLPKKAIKTLFNDDKTGKVRSLRETHPEEAFFHLGGSEDNQFRIFVEDALAAEVIRKALRMKGEATYKLFEVVFMPGGAEDLRQSFMLPEALSAGKKTLFILDGDERSRVALSLEQLDVIPDNQLDDTIKDLANGQRIKFLKDSGNSSRNQEILKKNMRQFCEFFIEYVSFLPGNGSPEQFILENLNQDPFEEVGIVPDPTATAKMKFRQLTQQLLGKEDFENVSSNEIFITQKMYLAQLDNVHFEPIAEAIDNFLGKQ
ncbi:AAA family ATPase [Oceanospirillum sp.]|uniref:AAA family ATPase n=1 Tax=Oceanospirillum sp. TaxID=2021254 RepID=UPI003A8F6A84